MTALKLKRAMNTLLREYLYLNNEESILIISDNKKQELSLIAFDLSKKITKDSYYLELGTQDENNLLPKIIFEASKAVDTILVIADIPLFQSKMIREISSLGIRVAIIPQISDEGLCRCMQANTEEILANAELFESKLANTSKIRVETKNGTNITLDIKGRTIYSDHGILKKIGEIGMIPNSKVSVSPIDKELNGTIVFDDFIDTIGLLKNNVSIQVEKGIVKNISGSGDPFKIISKLFDQFGENSINLVEFGLGINPKAIIANDLSENESTLGSCYFTFRDNATFGNKSDSQFRMTGVIEKPNIKLDDIPLITNGRLLI